MRKIHKKAESQQKSSLPAINKRQMGCIYRKYKSKTMLLHPGAIRPNTARLRHIRK